VDEHHSSSKASSEKRNSLLIVRESLRLFWIAADGFVKKRLALALATVTLGALLAAAGPVALKLLVDSLAQLRSMASDFVFAPFAFVAFYVVGQYLLRCSNEMRVMLHGHAEQRLRRRIGGYLFEHLVRLPLRFHLERKVGAVGETVEQGLRGYDLITQHVVYSIVPVTIEFVAIATILIRLDRPKYLLILGVSAIAYLLAFHRWATRIYEPSEYVSKSHIESHGVLTDSLANQEAIKYFDAERRICERYDIVLGRKETAWRRFFNEYAANGVIVSTIFGLSLGLSLVCGTQDVSRGNMTLGDFVLVNAYVMRLVQPLEMLGFAVRDISQGLAFLRSMLSVLREETELCGSSVTGDCMGARVGELNFENISFSYSDRRTILRNVSFKVPARRCVAIVGASGSGKSSLIRLLFRLYEPDSGRILIDGMPISQMPLSDVRGSIAVVNQDAVLFHDTIANNIAFGKFGATQADIEGAARLANLHEAIMSMPEKYETIVGERGLKLSGGERQRVAIARAALKKPLIAVFDEATSSLDSRTEAEILKNLATLSEQCNTLVIAHRLSTIIHADEILVLHSGAVVERGSHDELIERNGQYAALWRAQHSGIRPSREAHTSAA